MRELGLSDSALAVVSAGFVLLPFGWCSVAYQLLYESVLSSKRRAHPSVINGIGVVSAMLHQVPAMSPPGCDQVRREYQMAKQGFHLTQVTTRYGLGT